MSNERASRRESREAFFDSKQGKWNKIKTLAGTTPPKTLRLLLMPTKKDTVKPESINKADDKKIVIGGDVVGNDIVIGDNNTVNKTTIIQKFFNIFKSDAETLEHRNRRILLGHVENAWIKGVLDASLHGAALLDLGIKEDPNAVTQYPWAIKRESTDETLTEGIFMLLKQIYVKLKLNTFWRAK